MNDVELICCWGWNEFEFCNFDFFVNFIEFVDERDDDVREGEVESNAEIWWWDTDWVVRSSVRELFICWSAKFDMNGSEILSEDISLPLPESGESLDGHWVFGDVKVENNEGKRDKSVGRDGQVFNRSKFLLLVNLNSRSFV